uniref:CCHC-type domain-containing protein n=1 Tax=Tanacetum cinerariifolium TaxID=118510 RepID=A0A6L2JFM5_TANCI|nr:hypothetical protein [Tanacetum cinerariifolium]
MENNEEDHALVADEVAPTEFSLMANTSAESKVFDNSLCSKDCKKNNDSLNSKITDLTDKLFDANNLIYHYKLALAQVESRLVEYKEREVKYCEKIKTLEFYNESNNECIEILKNKLETLKEEKEGVDGKLAGLLKASKDLDNLIESQRPSPTIESTSRDEQNRNPSVSETIASPIIPKPFIKFVKPKDSQSKSKTGKTESPKKPPVKKRVRKSFTPKPIAHRPYRPPVRPVKTNMNVRSPYRAPWVPTVNKNFPPVNRKFSTGSRNFPTANKKFPTASRKFPTGSTKCSTADMGMKGKAGSSQNNINDKGYWDSGCSRYMIGNISYLSDFEPFDGGYVSFGQGGCKIIGKRTIKTGKLEFENVYFVKDLKYNLFIVSQICDNKNSILFTDSECIVLGRDFKLLDKANILLRTSRQHNMYSIDLNNIIPHRDLTCLVAKASADECMLWHRRLEDQNKDTSTSEETASTNPSKPFIKFVKPKDSQPESKIEKQETPKKPQVKNSEQNRQSNRRPKENQRNWNNLKSYQLGSEFVLHKKSCFNCGDFSHLAKDCKRRVQSETNSQPESKIEEQETPKKPQVKNSEQNRQSNRRPKGNQRNWNNLKSYQLGPEFVLHKKPCFNCGDFSHLAKDCRRRVQRETNRPQGNSMRPPFRPAGHKPHGPSMNPRRPTMNGARPYKTFFQTPSFETRPFLKSSAVNNSYRAPWVPTVNRYVPSVNRKLSTGRRNFPTAHRKFPTASRKFTTGSTKNHTADMGRKGKAGSSQNNIDDKGYWDSGCSRHMTGNISYLSNFEPFDGGYVSFGQGGCKITCKGTIKTVDAVTAVKAKQVNVVQGYKGNWGNPHQALKDKGVIDSGCSRHMTENISYLSDFEEINGGYIAFVGNLKGGKITGKDTECIVLSSDFKLPDENHVLLRVLRENNMYNVDLKNIVPSRDLTCLFAKATLVTDDFSRFTWTFFIKTKDESSGILRNFITEIENLKDLKNGVTKRRNRILIEAAKTMLADAKLPITFWVEAVNTSCYVQNRVLINKSQNKNPYELFNGRTPAIGFLKPFGCHVMILNTLDHLGKFEVKGDEGYFIRISSSKPQDHCSTEVPEGSGNPNPTASTSHPPADQMETLTVETPIPTVSSPVPTTYSTDSQEPSSDAKLISKRVVNQVETPSLDNILLLTNQFEDILGATTNSDESNGVEADISNMETAITASPTPTLRIHKDHLKSQIISPMDTPIQTRNKSKEISNALQDPRWVEAMQEELLQFKIQNVWTLVDCSKGASGSRAHQEEGIDYDEVFAPVARTEAIKLFLACASFMGFTVYQMDVKSAFFYGTINEEVEFEALMHEKSQMSAIGELNFFLGLQVLQKEDGIFLSQDKHQVTPKECHLHVVKRIFKYLKGHPKLGLWYPKESPFDLVAFSDSDYGESAA